MDIKNKKLIQTALSCKNIEASHIHALLLKGVSESYIFDSYKTNYIENKSMLQNKGIYLESYFTDYKEEESIEQARARFEAFNDDCAKAVKRQNGRRLMQPIRSKKDLFSIDGKTEDLFVTLAELGVDKQFVKDYIQPKISAFKSPEQLNNMLSKHISNFGFWNQSAQLEKIAENNCHVLSTLDNKIIYEVHNFEACKTMGSDDWCITREEDSFDMYRADVERIIFVFDLNKPYEDNESQTAYIVNAQGKAASGYYKNDDFMDSEKFAQYNTMFDRYTQSDFEQRLDSKGLSNEEMFLVLLVNDFTDYCDNEYDYCDFSNLSRESFNRITLSKNRDIYNKIVTDYPKMIENNADILDMLLREVLDSYALNQSEKSALFGKIIDNNSLARAIVELDTLDLADSPMNVLTYIDTPIAADCLLKLTKLNNSNCLEAMVNNKYFCDESLAIFATFEGIFETLKTKHPEKAVAILLSERCKDSAFEHIHITKDDKALLEKMKEGALEGKKCTTKLRLLEKLIEVEPRYEPTFDQYIIEEIKSSPKRLLTVNKRLAEKNYKLSKQDSLDVLSQFVFMENYAESKALDMEYNASMLCCFNIAMPFKKAVFTSSILNSDAKQDFVNELNSTFDKAVIANFTDLDQLKKSINIIKTLSSQEHNLVVQNQNCNQHR
jgi:hypothetical protein